MHSRPVSRLTLPLLIAAAVGCLMKLASGGIIDGTCGTGPNKNTGDKVKDSKFLSDSDLFNSAYDLPPAAKTVHYEVNCKEGYVRSCSVTVGVGRFQEQKSTKDRPDAAACKATLAAGKSQVATKNTGVDKDSAAKPKTSAGGKDLTAGVETVDFRSDRGQYATWKNRLSCTLTCHCFAVADLECN